MINEKELEIASDSYIKKDFYQIYPEILDIATKISKRWDPQSSNESDPGVVLLKLLAFIADKNNYNIDKNILEAFMPSASQESSMMKLCDMMGYNMKYYVSATTDISFMYQGDYFDDGSDKTFTLKAFDTVITNEDGDVAYILTQDVVFGGKNITITGSAIEGTLCEAVAGSSNVITLQNLDDNHRFYLPEVMVAENGIYIKNADESLAQSQDWKKVDNLNIYAAGNTVYKFGFDSRSNQPYVEFPDDISSLMGDGLIIKYIRTTGVNGNVSANTLTKFKSYKVDENVSLDETDNGAVMVINNFSASSNGQNKETLDEAYNNFKKTIGTFDTLVTCRDYANKIYQLVSQDDNTTPLVSNIQVSDIRDDLNAACNIITYNVNGINTKTVLKPTNVNEASGYNLYIYPYKPIVGGYSKSTFTNSFKPSTLNVNNIISQLEDYKTIAHNIVLPDNDTDLYCIKNYYNLKAKITTTYKVNTTEQNSILSNVYSALYKRFNLRNLDFGEAIPFDSILSCIQNADTRIKNVSLEEPEISTYVMDKSGMETALTPGSPEYIDCLAANILAGRLPLYNYNRDFNYRFGQTKNPDYDLIYGGGNTDATQIKSISTSAKIRVVKEDPNDPDPLPYTLGPNEVIQFMAPNYRTPVTYPAYVNYFLKIEDTTKTEIQAGEMYALQQGSSPDGQGDYLCINYTDSDDVVKNVIYTSDKIYTYSGSGELLKEESISPVVIKPNFTLTDSRSTSKLDFSKTFPEGANNVFDTKGFSIKNTLAGDDAYGMLTLGIQQQIEIKEHVVTELANTSKFTKCYWLVDATLDVHNNYIGEIPFVETASGSGIYEYILKDGEYFFYTNDAETELITLGSGTKLITNIDSNNAFVINYSESTLNEDDIASKGLAAFADIQWKEVNTLNGNYIQFQEMQYVTLSEGDVLRSIDGSFQILDNTLQPVNSAEYILQTEDGIQTLPNINVSGDGWQVRSRLDLNVGPNKTQILNSNDFITLTFMDDSQFPSSGDGINNTRINANYTIQCVGDDNINIQTANYNMETGITIVNDFELFVYDYVDPVNSDSVTIDLPASDDANPIMFQLTNDSPASITFNVVVPNDNEAKFMVFYEEGVDQPTLSSNVSNNLYTSRNSSPTNNIQIVDGLTIISVKQSCSLTLTKGNAIGNLSIGGLSMVQDIYASKGVDLKLLGLTSATATDLLDKIQYYDGSYLFYYNCPISNDNRIDTLTMTDNNVWYDYNNVYNKFVVSELLVTPSEEQFTGYSDAPKGNFPYITITTGSKL